MLLTRYKGPGCYRFLDTLENTIYIGSAKNIDRRLRSHFNGKQGHLGKEVYYKLRNLDKEKIDLTKKQDRALVVVAYSMFILLILRMIF